MFSFTLVALALMSAALAAGDLVAIHRENLRPTDYQDSEDEFSNNSGTSRRDIDTRSRSLVVRTSDFSISKRVLKGISQPGVLFSGYFDRTLAGITQLVEYKSFNLGVPGSIPGPGANEQRYENGISAYLRISGDSVNSRFESRGGSKPPLCTKVAA